MLERFGGDNAYISFDNGFYSGLQIDVIYCLLCKVNIMYTKHKFQFVPIVFPPLMTNHFTRGPHVDLLSVSTESGACEFVVYRKFSWILSLYIHSGPKPSMEILWLAHEPP